MRRDAWRNCKRAGAELPEARPAAVEVVPKPNGGAPTPEAMIEALEQQAGAFASPLVDPARKAAQAKPAARAEAPAQRIEPPGGAYVELNLARLRSQGFVTPDAPTSRIADEYRVDQAADHQERARSRATNGCATATWSW